MTQNLKIEVLTGDISIDGTVVTNLVTKEELSTAIVKKADLGTDGKIPTSQLPAEIVNTAGIVDEVKLQLETSIKDAVDESNAYAESYTDNALSSKADLTSGKVPLEQLPAIDQYPQFGTALSNLSTSILSATKQRTDQLEKTKADLGEDGKVLREQIPSYEKISGLPEQLEVMSTQTAAVSGELDEHKLQTADQIDTLKENIEANVQQLTDRQSHLMRTYATKELGVDAKVGVKPGEYFYVRSANEEEMLIEYQNVGSVATATGKTHPSAKAKWDSSKIMLGFGRTLQEKASEIFSVRDFGAIGDGVLHTVGEWTQIPSRIYYPNLAAIKVDYPHVTALTNSIDWAATQKAINTPNLFKLYMPCGVGLGRYEFGSNELVIPNSKSNITIIGDGTSDAGATIINSKPNKLGFIAVHSKAYGTTLQDLAILSTTGNNDGFEAIGFLHMRDVTGSTGRVCHRNLRIQGFSKHACKIGQAISYQMDGVTLTGGVETLWIGRDASNNQRSTTISVYNAYVTGGKRCGLYLDRPSDFLGDRLILESCGKGTDPLTGTFYEDAAGLIATGVGQGQLNSPYFEDNRRNIWSNSSIVIISANYGPATLPNVWDFSNPAAADNQKGRIELLRNGIRTRYLLADEYKGYIEVADDIRFNASAKFNIELITKSLFIGSSSKHGRGDGVHELTINSNMSGSANIGVVGQKLNFGVTNTSVGFTSRWMTLGHRRLDNTNTALAIYVDSGTTSFAPDGAPVKLGEWNSLLGLVLAPKVSATPTINGEMTFELTSNTQLKVKVMGSDGVVRSATLALT